MEVSRILRRLLQILGVDTAGDAVDLGWAIWHLFLRILGADTTGDGVAVAWAMTHGLLRGLAVIASVVGFLLPRTTMVEIVNDGTIGRRSSIPYIATFCSCVLGVLYGLSPKGNGLVILLNVFGAFWTIRYFLVFLHYCQELEYLWHIAFASAGVEGLTIVMSFYFHDMQSNLLFLCRVCAIWKGLVGVLPLRNLITVHRQRSLRSMPTLRASTIALLNAGLWAGVAYTASQWDGLAFWPSFAGMVSACIQILYRIFFREVVHVLHQD